MATPHWLCCCQRSTGELAHQGQGQQVMLPLCCSQQEASRGGVQLGSEVVQPPGPLLSNNSSCSRWP
jgi:hypothetical protein